MNTSKAFWLGAVLLAAAGSLLRAQTPVRVTANSVNLRAKPQPTAEVVAQANYDDRLLAREIGEEWVEVAAPAAVDLWVLKAYVKQPENTIGAQRVNLRAGPSINYNIVDTLSLGAPVEPRGEEVQDWLKVAPPASAHVWISREYVEIVSGAASAAAGDKKSAKNDEKDEKIAKKSKKSEKTEEISEKTDEKSAEAAKEEEKEPKKRKSKAKTEEIAPEALEAARAAEAALPTPIVSPSIPAKEDAVARDIPVPPPADLKLIPLEGQGRLSEVEGELRAAPLINEAPTRYRVVRWQNNRWQILCHVYGEAAKFRSLQDKRVRVKGREYWIQGAAAPVLIPDQVQELAGE